MTDSAAPGLTDAEARKLILAARPDYLQNYMVTNIDLAVAKHCYAAGQAHPQGQGERCQHSLDMARLRVAELELLDSFAAPAAQGQVSAIPREPTPEMIDAGRRAPWTREDTTSAIVELVWRAMYDAASPPAGTVAEPCQHQYGETEGRGFRECRLCGLTLHNGPAWLTPEISSIVDAPTKPHAGQEPDARGDALVRRLRDQQPMIAHEAADRIDADAARIAEFAQLSADDAELIDELRDMTAPEYIDGKPSCSPRDQILQNAATSIESLHGKYNYQKRRAETAEAALAQAVALLREVAESREHRTVIGKVRAFIAALDAKASDGAA